MLQSAPNIRRLESRTRTLPATNASAEFILNSVPLAETSQYVPELDRFVPLSEAQRHGDAFLALWRDSAIESEKLSASLELLAQKLRTSENTKTTTEPRRFTWNQVITEVQAASDTYQNDRGKVKRIFDSMCENANIFEHWLCLLPNGDYGATISGAFVMLVQAARTTSEIRRIIYETLASIPDALTHASTYIEIYNAHSSEALVEKTAALCKCILVLLQLIVRFFLKGSFKRGVTAVLKGSAFEDELKNSVQDMKNHVLKLREEANLCLQKRIAEMDRKNDLRECREQTRQQLAKGELLLAIESSAKVTAETVCTYLLRQLQATPDFNVRTGSLSPQFATSLQIANEATLRPEIVAQETVSPTPEDLLAMLEYDNTSQQKDIEYSLTLGYTQSDAAHARSTWVLQSPEMGEFLAGKAGSRLLLINGNGEAIEFISPLSFVCAKISDLINLSHQIILATHFCGHHTDELRDPRANVQGMLTSLVGQLLTHVKRWERSDFRLDLSSISDDKCNAIQQEDKDALFDLFRAIIMQLPKNTIIFCLIDGLSAYENSNRKKDTIAFMRKLARLVQKSSRVALRVLVTFPGQSIYADHWRGFDGKKAKMLYVPTDL